MPKIDPFKNKRLRPITETKTFKDPAQPGVEFTLTLSSKPGSGTNLAIRALAQNLFDRFGDKMSQGIWLVDEDGSKTEAAVTYPLCYVCASILTLNSATPSESYSFEELVALSYTMPSAFDEAIDWATALSEKYEGSEEETTSAGTVVPNGSAEDTGSGSEPPQTIT